MNLHEDDPDPAQEAELAEVRRVVRQALTEALPPHLRETLKRRQAAVKKKYRIAQGQRAYRMRRMMELILSGHTQAEMEKALAIHRATVSRDLKFGWPFGHPGPDYRYLAVRVKASHLPALDKLAADAKLPRLRAAEEILSANLEEDAGAARRILKITRSAS